TQFLRMSVLHEVSFGLQLLGLPAKEIELRVQESLEMVGLEYLFQEAEYIHPNDLSGGQKQRVAIAAFLAMRPSLLILDEPTSDLDPKGKSEVMETVHRLRESHHMTVVLVEHDPEILSEFCDRIALIDDGNVRLIESADKFYRQAEILDEYGVHKFEVSEIAVRSGIKYKGTVPTRVEECLTCFPNELRKALRIPQNALSTDLALEAQELEYLYRDGTYALRGASFRIHQGEMSALLGANGSGKTTVAKILSGIYRPTAGTVKLLGQDITRPNIRRQLPRNVGYVFQNPDHQIFTRQVRDEIAYGLKNLEVPKNEMERRIAEVLDLVGLADKANEDPLFLGKGERQRLAVASVLAMRPQIIIVDEPTTGQDYRMTQGMMELLKRLHEQGKTILIITHSMNLVAEYCQRAIVLDNGQVAFAGTPRELFFSPEIVTAMKLNVPQPVSLSAAMRVRNERFPLFSNTSEWISGLQAQSITKGASTTVNMC
ncbi:partial Putative HMP/thiamine import ATP-binding protein YkoD, partial [Anaerolineae bacterium]